VDTAEVRGRCTRRFAQNATRNAKFLLNPVMTVRYIARSAFQSVRTKSAKSESNGEGSGIEPGKKEEHPWAIKAGKTRINTTNK